VKHETRAAETPPQSAAPHVQDADSGLETARTWERPLLIPLDLADAQNSAGSHHIPDAGVCS
jgi:hypothetical protein